MNKIKIIFLLAIGLATPAYSQLDNMIGKTKAQLSQIVTGQTVPNKTWFESQIFQRFVELTNAFQGRTVNPADFSSLAAAIDTANARNVPLVVNSCVTLSATDTVEALFIDYNGCVTINAGVTLNVSRYFDAVPDSAFTYANSTTSQVVFFPGTVDRVFTEWWGARNDSTVDCGVPFKRAFDAAPSGTTVQLLGVTTNLSGSKGYIINTTVRVPSRKNIVLEGNGTVIFSSAADTVFLIQNGSQASIPSYAVSPTTIQPRHVFNNIRFKRITGSTGSGVAIALINSTGQTFNNIDVADYNNAFVFHNISDGWCENNEIFNSRIAACDTGILYMRSLSGNNSMATNSLRKVTITRFTDADVINQDQSQAVGIFADTGTNLYRNVWDQVVIFPKDSVTCVSIDGKAEDLSGTINFEYIGDTATTRMRGFHFGANSSELRFNLHMNLTGRVYFPTGLMFYSQIAGNFGYSGITTTFDGNHNHGIETVVDSSKFTTIYSIVSNNNRLTKSTIGDSARIFYANVNNSADGKLDLRARRNKTVEFRSLTDNVYSSATANSIGGSALPLQPVRLLDIGGRRTADDSTLLDVRNTTDLLFGSDGSAADLADGGYYDVLATFAGGIAGQQLFVNFADDSVVVANLSGASGSGRIFLIGNRTQKMPKGTKSLFYFESESGGVFAREVFRSLPIDSVAWNPGNLASGAVDSVDVTYIGAMVGDPVVVGFAGITSTTADFDLNAYVVASDTIRVFLRNNNAGAYNPPSAKLRFKIIH